MQHFIHGENLKLLKKQLEATTDEARRWMLLRLLAEEEAKGEQLGEEGEKGADREPSVMVLMEQS